MKADLLVLKEAGATELYALSLHDALPISSEFVVTTAIEEGLSGGLGLPGLHGRGAVNGLANALVDRKSTRLNSSHVEISYAVFCLKKKKDHVHLVRNTFNSSSNAENSTNA